jgi:PPOX class probable F420-dependent enzyme
MEKMSPERIFEFVNEGARTAVIAWVGSDGHPHVTPIWITTDGVPGDFTVLFTTGADTPKGKALRRDPRTSLVVDNQTAPFSFVKINGVVELIDDVPTVRRWATVLGGRYMGTDRAEEFGARNGVPGELLVRVTPTKIIAVDGEAD